MTHPAAIELTDVFSESCKSKDSSHLKHRVSTSNFLPAVSVRAASLRAHASSAPQEFEVFGTSLESTERYGMRADKCGNVTCWGSLPFSDVAKVCLAHWRARESRSSLGDDGETRATPTSPTAYQHASQRRGRRAGRRNLAHDGDSHINPFKCLSMGPVWYPYGPGRVARVFFSTRPLQSCLASF